MLLLIILMLLLFGGLPTWGYHQWGYTPSIGIGTILLVVVVLMLLGRL
jgi:uncharacterized protein DUF3309